MINWMHILCQLYVIFVFLEISQKPPSRLSKPPGDSCEIHCISGFLQGTAWRQVQHPDRLLRV